MKNISFILFSLLVTIKLFGQPEQLPGKDSIAIYFSEFRKSAEKAYKLWNTNLYGPILLVDLDTRRVYANEPDTVGALRKDGSIYTGVLSPKINMSNTALNWNGKRWAMIILQHVPRNRFDRLNMFAHESFHRVQPSLGFTLSSEINNHLDQRDGRIYLRLELEALKKAVLATTVKEQRQHLANAFLFRKYRQSLYPGSDTTENMLEVNEGISEYTGVMVSGRGRQTAAHLANSIDSFFNNPTYVRSFVYNTTPVYGYLLSRTKSNWNKDIHNNTDLAAYFMNAFGIELPSDMNTAISSAQNSYNGQNIVQQEKQREEETLRKVAEFRKKFVEQPHLELVFEKMNISFDPRNIIPVEDRGNVYMTIRVVDNWGILTVQKGALLSGDWKRITVTAPEKNSDKIIEGDGWMLELAANYRLEKDATTGNYKLSKN